MKYYEDFLKLRCFCFDEVVKTVGSEKAALSILRQYIKKGYVVKIRRGLYSAINLLDHEPAASQYLIASKLTDTAVVSHHAAFAYHGYSNQVSYEISVTSETKFNSFSFNGFTYHRVLPHITKGIIQSAEGARITDPERTVLDSVNDFENEMGFEELIQCISSIPLLDEDKLTDYLAEYDKCFLYQKTGFIFDHFQNEFAVSDQFLSLCRKRSGNSSRYLFSEIPKKRMAFSSKWHLTIPYDLWNNTMNGDDENADV